MEIEFAPAKRPFVGLSVGEKDDLLLYSCEQILKATTTTTTIGGRNRDMKIATCEGRYENVTFCCWKNRKLREILVIESLAEEFIGRLPPALNVNKYGTK